nr:hypothetical protein [Candidatus Sigynarchaeum springense]
MDRLSFVALSASLLYSNRLSLERCLVTSGIVGGTGLPPLQRATASISSVSVPTFSALASHDTSSSRITSLKMLSNAICRAFTATARVASPCGDIKIGQPRICET